MRFRFDRFNLPLRKVAGPLWPLWTTLWATLVLVTLMFVAAAWGGQGVNLGVTQFMALAAGGIVAAACFDGSMRLAQQQRIWQLRLAPSAASRRLRRAAALGLVLAALGSLPVLLLAALTRDGALPPAAMASFLSLMLVTATATATTFHGGLPWYGALPCLLLLFSLLALGVDGWWAHWLRLPAALHGLLTALTWPLALALLYVRPRVQTTPVELARQTLGRWWTGWRQRHQYLRRHGENSVGSVIWIFAVYPGWIGRERAGWEGLLSGFMGLAMLTLLVWHLLVGPAMHWRHQLAPGRWHRSRLGWRILGHSLQHHIVLGLISLGTYAALHSLFSRGGLAPLAEALPAAACTVVARWLLVMMLVTWLRGLNLKPWSLVGVAAACVAMAALAHAGLALLLGASPLVSWVVTALAATLLLRPIQRAWMQRDLSDYLPRAKPDSAR